MTFLGAVMQLCCIVLLDAILNNLTPINFSDYD